MPRSAPESLDTDLATLALDDTSALNDAILAIDTANVEV